MKDKKIQLISKKCPTLILEIINNDFSCIVDIDENAKGDTLITDSASYAVELYKLTERAIRMGALPNQEVLSDEEEKIFI